MICHSQEGAHQQMSRSLVKQEQAADATTAATAKEAVNVGNKICPVSGDKIKEETKATYEYEGRIYNFCCPQCIEEFKKEPQKYIKKVEEELQGRLKEEPKEEKETAPEPVMPMGTSTGHQHSH